MGIASMVIGIVSLAVGWFPFCGTWAIAPACVGLGLGIADVVVKSKRGLPKGMAIAGLIMNPLAILVIVLWWALAISAAHDAASEIDPQLGQQMMQLMQNTQNLQNMPGMQPQPGQPAQNPALIPSQPAPVQPMQPMQPVPNDAPPPSPQPQPSLQPQPAPQATPPPALQP
jgi:hypothetical protein